MALKNVVESDSAAKQLADWLGGKMPDARDIAVTDVHVPGAGGLSNETVLFTAAWNEDGVTVTRGMVARVQPDGPGVFPDYDLHKEATVISALADHSPVPVPAVYYYEESPAIFGAPFLVMQRVDGRVPTDDPPFTAAGWVLELTAEQRELMWKNSIETLAQIHSVDWRAAGLGFLDSPEHHSGLDACLAHWRRTFEWAAEGEPNPTIEAALAWLEDNRPDDEQTVLNWGDARVGNIIFADDLSVAAVLDWEMVALGCREQDLGWWAFLMRHHTDGVGLPLPQGIPDREVMLDQYAQFTGYRARNIDYYEILAGTQLSILMVRAAHMMIAAGMMPPESPMALANPASILLAELLGLPAPTGESTSFIGNR